MLEYVASGYIEIDRSGYPILTKKKGCMNDSINLIEDIKKTILSNSKFGTYEDKNTMLGGEIHTVPNCNISIWFTKGEKSISDVQNTVIALLYGGAYSVDVDYEGYSEFTITDYNLNEFTIGGHDLKKIFENKIGKYCNFRMEMYTPISGLSCSNVYEMKKIVTFPDGTNTYAGELLSVIEDLANGESLVIYDDDIKKYLFSQKLIHSDGCSYSSVSAISMKEMEKFYNLVSKMVWEEED